MTTWWTMKPMYQPSAFLIVRLTTSAERLLRIRRDRRVDVRRTVDEGKRLAETGLPLESDRRELEEQLVELALEPGGKIA